MTTHFDPATQDQDELFPLCFQPSWYIVFTRTDLTGNVFSQTAEPVDDRKAAQTTVNEFNRQAHPGVHARLVLVEHRVIL